MKVSGLFYKYLLTLGIFLVLDSVWLGFVADGFYQEKIGHLMGEVNWLAAVFFYLIYVAGIVYFALMPSLLTGGNSIFLAAKKGALLGAVTYATYDLTNLATLKGWPVDMVLIDIVWGIFITGVTSAASVALLLKAGLIKNSQN